MSWSLPASSSQAASSPLRKDSSGATAAVAAHGEQGLWSENEGYEYPLVLIVVAGLIGRSRPPAAIGVPYVKE
jgi:hypothetical protein